MLIRNSLSLLALLPVLQVAHAAVTVGSCQSHPYTKSYATISQAITAARAGETIDVCPGTYPEQLTITKPLTIEGITIAGQAGATITAPASGLQEMPAGSGFYPQVYANRAGAVVIRNIAVDGTGANILFSQILFDTTTACQVGFIKDFSGIYFSNTTGEVRNASVKGHFANSDTPDGPQLYPNCGSGIEFANRSEAGLVSDSVINGYGYTGISSTGPVRVRRNVLTSDSGPYQVGISVPKKESVVEENTVSGLQFNQSTGIQGGEFVTDNVVQGWLLGIVNARQVKHNTLLNNAIGISDPDEATTNLITAPALYTDPACTTGACRPGQTTKASVGIDVECEDSSLVRGNEMVGVGVGIADVKKSQMASASNLYAGVGTTMTSCAASTNGSRK
ncbi:MAG TPA: hypothetical protein VIM62_07725 [Acidobacteriaceae bacterium]